MPNVKRKTDGALAVAEKWAGGEEVPAFALTEMTTVSVDWIADAWRLTVNGTYPSRSGAIKTTTTGSPGDWLVKHPGGEVFVLTLDEFDGGYEPA